MAAHPDILVRNRDDVPIAAIEVKNLREWPESLSSAMRRNMIAHGVLPKVPFFLLLSQEKGFAWRESGEPAVDSLDRKPDVEFPMAQVVQRYAPPGLGDHWLRGAELEFIVLRWLDDLATGNRHDGDRAEETLEEIGFITAIENASVLPEAVL